MTNIEMEETVYKKREFNWTNFNERIIGIYHYIDTLIHQNDQYYDLKRLEKLKENFKISWTTNLTSKEAWEIR